MKTRGSKTVELLYEYGARFVKVRGKSPGLNGSGWQNNPSGKEEAIAWLEDGLSVGMITGDSSQGLILLDVDGYYEDGKFKGKGLQEFLWTFPDFYETPIIVREGGDKGKLVIRPSELPPRRKVRMKKGQKPYFEILSFGNMGVVAGPHPTGVPYEMGNAQFPPTKVTLNRLVDVFNKWTGKELSRSSGRIDELRGSLDEELIGKEEKERLFRIFKYIVGVTNARPGSEGNYLGYCPAHPDERDSFSVGTSRDKVFVYCFAGCSYHDILDALELTPEQMKARKRKYAV